MRAFAAGSDESGVDDRIVMCVEPFLTGSTKLPVNVAPAWSRIVSPGRARLSAAWKSPPLLTTIWLPEVGGGGGGGGAGEGAGAGAGVGAGAGAGAGAGVGTVVPAPLV